MDIKRYKIGYHSDEWGMTSSTPSGIPDAQGAWVRYEDHIASLKSENVPKHKPVGYAYPLEIKELSEANGMSIWVENTGIHSDDPDITAKGLIPLYTSGPTENQDLALIKQMVEAMCSLEGVGNVIEWKGQWELIHAAITAANKRLNEV